MKKLLFVLLVFAGSLSVLTGSAQERDNAKPKNEKKKKAAPEPKKAPGVIVIGNGNAALAAAYQAAQSNVLSTLILGADDFAVSLPANTRRAGVEATLFRRLLKASGDKDSSGTRVFLPSVMSAALKGLADSTTNLSVIRGTADFRIERAGRGWTVRLADGRTIRGRALVLAGKADLSRVKEFKMLTPRSRPYDPNEPVYRTSVGAAEDGRSFYAMYDLYDEKQENIVFAHAPGASFALGQAAGAVAAYTAFFDSKTSTSDLKTIQGELMAFKLPPIPFSDITIQDPNFREIQQIGLTGILKGIPAGGGFSFSPDQTVGYEEVKQPLKDFYYKAQIWFDDHTQGPLTIERIISLVAYVGNETPQAARANMEKRWKSAYKFKTAFDPARVVTRREFAVLLYDFLKPKPFDIRVDRTGRILR